MPERIALWRTTAAKKTTPAFRTSESTSAAPVLGHEDPDRAQRGEVGQRRDLHGLVDVDVRLAPGRHRPDRDVLREERRELPRTPASREDEVAAADDLVLGHEVEDQRLAGGFAVTDEAEGPRVGVVPRDREARVGQERHLRGRARRLRDVSDEVARAVDDGVVEADGVVPAGGEYEMLLDLGRY